MIRLSEIKYEKVQPLINIKETPEKCAQKIFIDNKVCSKNYNCVSFCPKNAIKINEKGFPIIDDTLCDGCLICLRECPSGAIKEVKK